MHAFRTLLTLLAFTLVSVSAAPTAHRRRRTCRAPTTTAEVTTSVISSSLLPTPTADPTTTFVDAPTTTHHTTTKVATTQEPETNAEETTTKKTSSHHSSATTEQPAATQSANSGKGDSNNSGSTGQLKKLFPVPHSSSWTTSSASDNALPLNDKTLGVTKLLSALSHDYVNAPDGKLSVKAHYPEGSYTFGHDPLGGFSFYAKGPSNFDLESAKEVTFSYSAYFEEDFDWNKGGKMPGMFGGNDDDVATSCSGGRRDDRCFSTRFMWRTDGKGEIYSYLPPSYDANRAVCNVAPESDCNDTYGASIGRGSFYFKAGRRSTIGQRVRLNDVGKENGEIELFVEGKSIFTVKGLVLRNSNSGKFRGVQMQTFFGGSESSWASPKSQNAYFSDFSLAITETF